MKYILLLLCCLSITFNSCKKDNDIFPDLTHEGKNFLACKVNGKIQIYSGKGEYLRPDGVGFGDYQDNIKISGSGSADYKTILGMRLNKDTTAQLETGKQYWFGDESGQNTAVYFSYPTGSANLDYFTRSNSGWIRFSRLDSVASGTFEFTAYAYTSNSNPIIQDSVHITEGRFDISRK